MPAMLAGDSPGVQENRAGAKTMPAMLAGDSRGVQNRSAWILRSVASRVGRLKGGAPSTGRQWDILMAGGDVF
jgi:hypothetical protein